MANVKVEQFQARFCLSYALVSEGECVLIDPHSMLLKAYRDFFSKTGKVKAIIDTHTHADHISSAVACAQEFDCPIYMSNNSPLSKPFKKVGEGDRITFGGTEIEVLASPGHTSDSIALLCEGMLFSGDVLLIDSVGRCDFQNGSPESMFETLGRFKERFGAETVLYPAHDYKGNLKSTVGEQLEDNPFFKASNQEEFEKMVTEKEIPKPADMDSILKINTEGFTGQVLPLSPAQFEEKREDEQWLLVDVRNADEYASVHIEPSVNIPLSEIGSRAGELLGNGKKLVLSCKSGARALTAANALLAAGGTELYVLDGAISAWQKEDRPVVKSGAAFTIQRQVLTIAGALIIIGSVLTMCLDSKLWVLICLWVGLGLFVAGVSGTCLMAGMLLKLPWNKVEVKPQGSCESGGGCSL